MYHKNANGGAPYRAAKGKKYKVYKKKKIKKWSDRFDQDKDRQFGMKELKRMFTDLYPKERSPSTEDLEFLIHEVNLATGHYGNDRNICGDDIFFTVEKYHDYLKEKKYYDKLFKKYDDNNSGRISRKELKDMLEDLIQDDPLIPEAFKTVDGQDVQHILDVCDKDHSGGIESKEMKCAVAEWRMYAREHHKPQHSFFCNVL